MTNNVLPFSRSIVDKIFALLASLVIAEKEPWQSLAKV